MAVTKRASMTMREHALKLASVGLRVLPLNGKAPMGGNGVKDATADELQIEAWWERHPKANIGIAGGNGIAIVDVDLHGKRDGTAALKKLMYGHEKDFKTVSAKSGGGGRHFYFGVTKDMWVPNSKDRVGYGIEIISSDKYVVAPPSLHPSTHKRYEWVRDPWEAQCLRMPDWLAQLNVTNSANGTWDKMVEEIKEHEGRNVYLTSLAGSLRRTGATHPEIYDVLVARNARICSPPLSTKDLANIAKSVSRYKPESVLITSPLNDTGNGTRLEFFIKDQAIYVPDVGWHTWSGRRWRYDSKDLRVQELAKVVSTEIAQAADDAIKDPAIKGNIKKFALSSGNMNRIRNMLESASSKNTIRVDVDKLDTNADCINLLNGTFNLVSNTIHEHKAEDYFTQIARVEYDPEAECPRWMNFLEQILPEEGLMGYVQRAIGYSLTGNTDEQCFFLMYGTGSNGKSTFIETIKFMMGSYATKMSTATVMAGTARRAGSASPDLMRLRGPRLVIAAEAGSDAELNEPVIKDLTGKDTLTARGLYEKHEIEYVPQFKLWMYSNYKPTIHGMDDGIWRRIRLIPFTERITNPDKSLGDRLKIEMPGIFNWALRGYHEWQKYGLKEPKIMAKEVSNYKVSMDTIAEFLEEHCEKGTGFVVAAADLWDEYSKYQFNVPPNKRMGKNRFYERMIAAGFSRERVTLMKGGNAVQSFRGIKIQADRSILL